jgi:glycine C-acetyltransferase
MKSMNKLAYLEEKIEQLKKDGVYRILPVNAGPCANVITLNGKRIVNLSANNYLGLATHPRVIAAAKSALERYGVGAGSVRTIVGNQDLLEKLESTIAEFKRKKPSPYSNPGSIAISGRFPRSPTRKI